VIQRVCDAPARSRVRPALLSTLVSLFGCTVGVEGLGADPAPCGFSEADAAPACKTIGPLGSTAPGADDAAGADREAVRASPQATVDAAGDTGAADAARGLGDVAPDSDAGCGPTDDVKSCGACGQSCDVQTGAPSCNGATCSYACRAGRADCNASIAPDTDGCECATPACCGTACQTAHDNGLGQFFYDCNPPGTLDAQAALSACLAYARSQGSPSSMCSGDWSCDGSERAACYATTTNSSSCVMCWAYTGSVKGEAIDCECPGNPLGSWN
jgi:hypothetical protein